MSEVVPLSIGIRLLGLLWCNCFLSNVDLLVREVVLDRYICFSAGIGLTGCSIARVSPVGFRLGV